jgi:hypothetical protein
MVSAMVNLTKDATKIFLDELRTLLLVKTEDETKVKDVLSKHPLFAHKQLEAAFIDQIVMGCLSENVKKYLATAPISNDKLPSDLILAESSQAKKTKLACGTPVWTQGHPFNKAVESSRTDLYKRWSGSDTKQRKTVFAAVCPDIALLAPFRVIFEGKFFNQPGKQIATSQLVSGLYQTFFYRAMPAKPRGTAGLKYGWDYEYACFLAYDATPKRRLRQAWDDLNEGTRKRFWEDSNIYVMMLPESAA